MVCDISIAICVKAKVYKMTVRPVVVYVWGMVALTKRQEAELKMFESED